MAISVKVRVAERLEALIRKMVLTRQLVRPYDYRDDLGGHVLSGGVSMKRILFVASVLAASFITGPAGALDLKILNNLKEIPAGQPFYVLGNSLAKQCSKEASQKDQLLCLGYVMGQADAFTMWMTWDNHPECHTPKTADVGRVRDIAVEAIEKMTEHQDAPAASIVLNAFLLVFCPEQVNEAFVKPGQ